MPREPTQSDRTKHPAPARSSVLDAATAATDSRSIGDRLSSGPSSASDPLTCLAHHVHRCRHANFAHGGRRPSRGRREAPRGTVNVRNPAYVNSSCPQRSSALGATICSKGAKIDVPHARKAHLGGLLRVPWAVFRAHIQSNGSSGVSKSLASDSASGEEPAVAINSGRGLGEGLGRHTRLVSK